MTVRIPQRNNRILVIDDDPLIHGVLRQILSRATPESEKSAVTFLVDIASQGEEGLCKIRAAAEAGLPYAMAFVDLRMPPGWDGVETIQQIWKSYPELQVVVCSSGLKYSWDDLIQALGQSDNLLFLKKPFDRTEVLQLAHTLTEKWTLSHHVRCRLHNLDQLVTQRTIELQAANDQLKKEILDRMHAEQALRLSEERFSKAFKSSPVPLAIQSLLEEYFVDANQGFLNLVGFRSDELIGHSPRQLTLWNDPEAEAVMLQKLRAEMSVRNLPCRFRSKDRGLLDVMLSVEVIELDGKPFLLTIAEDITGQIKLENQLRQAQKMEAVGQLAAGVAHDFNNLLTVVQGNASLLLTDVRDDSPEHRPLSNICAAAERASRLVRQLLTFSRKQLPELRPTRLAEVLGNLAEMLPRVLPEIVTVKVQPAAGVPHVNADAGMMETVLMNLAINARDAMPDGGALTLGVEVVELTQESVRDNADAREGRFVRVSVADTGEGIPPEVLPRIFEPFFTTKEPGKGTGLGLSMVYGIVKQHNGWIEIETQRGRGTTFFVFLPALGEQTAAPQAAAPPAAPSGGSETILVVEDEPDLRELVVQVLESRGYRVIPAGSPNEALECWATRKDEIQLLLTDIVMPDGMSGQKLAARLRSEAPQLRVVFTSGYSPGMPGSGLSDIEEANFLGKPYRPAKLLQVVRDCLDRTPAACAA